MDFFDTIICFCTFDLSCPILEKDNFIEHLYIVLSSYIAIFFNLVLFFVFCYYVCIVVFVYFLFIIDVYLVVVVVGFVGFGFFNYLLLFFKLVLVYLDLV